MSPTFIASPDASRLPPGPDLSSTDEAVFVLPATAAQQGFWKHDRAAPGNPVFNIAVRFRLRGTLRTDVLARALNEIVRRHETLRTAFALQEGAVVQVVSPRIEVAIPCDDLRGTDAERRAEAMAVEEARRPFDLTAAPLIRARLARLGEEDHVLFVTVHHSIADGWSMGIITNELAALYEAFHQGKPSPLPDLPLQYADYAIWQKEMLESGIWDAQLHYWAKQLADLPPVELPADKRKPAVRTSGGEIESIVLPKSLTDALGVLSQKAGASAFMIFVASLQVLLRRYCYQDDLAIGALVAGRSSADLEPLIGPFANALVLRGDLSGDPTFAELLARTRETITEAMSNQDVPFERVVQMVRPRRSGRHPLHRINLIFQRAFLKPFQTCGLTMTPVPSVSPGATYDLTFFMVEREQEWRMSCEYSTDLYEGESIRRLLAHFQAALEKVTADPQARLSSVLRPPATPADARPAEAAGKGAAPAAPRPARAAGSDRFEAQATEVWKAVLGRPPASPAADFFDEGGDHQAAAKLLALIEQKLRKRVSLATFVEAPTIRTLAASLRKQQASVRPSQVFAMQPEGNRPALALIDAGPFFRPLVKHLGRQRPILGVSLPDVADLPDPFSVADVGASLVAALSAAQPQGPYHLGGWSRAGTLAYEVAQQLRARGEAVATLTLFDTTNPAYFRRFSGWKATHVRCYFFFQKLFHQLRLSRRLGFREGMKQFWDRVFRKKPIVRLAAMVEGDEDLESLKEYAASLEKQYSVVPGYTPQPYDSPMILFRSEVLKSGLFRDERLGWGSCALGGLLAHTMPGEHDSMFLEPVVGDLAAALNGYLDRFEASATSQPTR